MSSWLPPLDLLTLCGFAAGCTVVGLLGLVLQGMVKRKQRAGVEIGLFTLVGLTGVANWLAGLPGATFALLGVLGVGGVLALFRLAFLSRLGTLAQALLSHSAVLWAGLLLVGVGTLIVQLRSLEESAAPEFNVEQVAGEVSVEEALQPVETQLAVTDAGHAVRLFTIPAETSLLAPDSESRLIARNQLEAELIRTDEADTRYNCHGFVFAGGRYWVRGCFVEPILRDNGYQTVTAPRPGDIVVYRDRLSAQVAHTALVRTVIEETGAVLVESKLGSLGRFIHTVDKHPYDNTAATYYRTNRGSHTLRGLDGVRRPTLVNAR